MAKSEKQNLFPMLLKIDRDLCVVVGGGVVAAAKVRSLLDCGARVRVVSPELGADMREVLAAKGVEWVLREYSEGDLIGARLVVSATDDPAVNRRVRADASRLGVLVNVVDEYDDCDFIYPSVLRRGNLVVAISTQGRVPALSRYLREHLEEELGPEYAELVSLLAEARERLKAVAGLDDKGRYEVLKGLLERDLIGLIRSGRKAEAEEEMRSCVSRLLV